MSLKEDIYQIAGNQHDSINSNLQLFADINKYPFLKDEVAQVALMPALFHYLLTGNIVNDCSIASTSGLLNYNHKEWDHSLMAGLGLPVKWFGTVYGSKIIGTITVIQNKGGNTVNYETIIGLEVHIELRTKSKVFSPTLNTFGDGQNTNTNIVDWGYPGVLSVVNKKANEYGFESCHGVELPHYAGAALRP